MNWFRYHTDALDNPKVQELPPELFKFWVNLLCLARLYDGVLPDDRTIAFRLRMPLTSTPDNDTSDAHNTVHKYYMDATSALHELEMRGLLDRERGRYRTAGNADPGGEALASVCHVLFNTNEFLYVE